MTIESNQHNSSCSSRWEASSSNTRHPLRLADFWIVQAGGGEGYGYEPDYLLLETVLHLPVTRN